MVKLLLWYILFFANLLIVIGDIVALILQIVSFGEEIILLCFSGYCIYQLYLQMNVGKKSS